MKTKTSSTIVEELLKLVGACNPPVLRLLDMLLQRLCSLSTTSISLVSRLSNLDPITISLSSQCATDNHMRSSVV